jgi:TolB protein
MRKLITLIFTLTSLSLIAAEEKFKDFTFIAVGEATLEQQNILIDKPSVEGKLSLAEKNFVEELAELIRNDFSFYKKIFEVKLSTTPITDNFISLKEKSVEYFIKLDFSKIGNKLVYQIQAMDISQDKIIYNNAGNLEAEGLRTLGHFMTNQIYKKIMGKKSIFQSKIAFVSDRTSNYNKMIIKKELYIMDFDGKNIKRLTAHQATVLSPAFSNDGKKISYSLIEMMSKRQRNVNLYIYDLTTGKSKRVSSRKGINSGAIFTPDDKSLILTMSFSGNAEIYKLNIQTKAIQRLTKHYSPDVDPSLSADGKTLTFLSGRPGKAMIYTLDPTGREKSVKRIGFIGQFNATPRFDPEGKEIAFSAWMGNGFDIFRINANGTGLGRLTKNFGSNEDPTYSNDGEFIAFSSQRVLSRKKAVQTLYIMDRYGEITGSITSKFGNCTSPRWSK